MATNEDRIAANAEIDEKVLKTIEEGVHRQWMTITKHLGFGDDRVTDRSLQRLRKKKLIKYDGPNRRWKKV
jgi:hypothetical protein